MQSLASISKIEVIAEEIKKELRAKGLLYISDVKAKYKDIAERDFNLVLQNLDKNASIARDNEVLSLLTLKSSTEQELYSHILALEKISMNPDYYKAGNTLYRGFIIVANPQSIETGAFQQLLLSKNNLHTALHISPESSIKMVHHLKAELSEIERKLNYFALEGRIIGKEIDELRDRELFLKDKIEKFSAGALKAFKLYLTFAVEGTSGDDLNFTTNKMMTFLKKLGFVVKMAINYQKDVLKTMVPSGGNFLKRRPTIVTNNFLADSFPFVK